MSEHYVPRIGGEWENLGYLTAAEAWGRIMDEIHNYLGALEEARLTNEHAVWEMFADRITAQSLKPWATEEMLEGPDGKFWGVSLEVSN